MREFLGSTSSYHEFHRQLFMDPGRALTPAERWLVDDPAMEPAREKPAPRRRAPLPRWRPRALACNPQAIGENLEAPISPSVGSCARGHARPSFRCHGLQRP